MKPTKHSARVAYLLNAKATILARIEANGFELTSFTKFDLGLVNSELARFGKDGVLV